VRGARAALVLVAFLAVSAFAEDRLVVIPTRPGVKVGYWMMERPGAVATLLLLPGGEGGIGFKGGTPTSTNFLVRSRDLFAGRGFNVAIVGKPTDHDDLDEVFRATPSHVEDLRRVIENLHTQYGKPVWLVGTSRGTISAAAAAIALGDAIGGVVLTSSITRPDDPAAVQNLPLAKIRVPVLVMHHKRDSCRATPPSEAPRIMERLTGAPAKKLVMVDGGGGPYGGACQPMHWHGFIGMEQEAVDTIADFIRDRQPERPGARGPSPDS
jgi:pimeloyl-ACP methyl ester carboxylesterase